MDPIMWMGAMLQHIPLPAAPKIKKCGMALK